MSENQQSLRAVIVVLNGQFNISSQTCSPMAPLVDRPFLQHVVECLVDRGVKRIEFLLHDFADRVEQHFGNGQRWGAQFTYHLLKDDAHPYSRLSVLGVTNEPFLLLDGGLLQPAAWNTAIESEDWTPTAFVRADDESDIGAERQAPGGAAVATLPKAAAWAGAALVTPQQWAQLSVHASGHEFVTTLVESSEELGALVQVAEPLSAESFDDLLTSQGRVLNGEFPELIRFASKSDEQIWIGRNVSIDTSRVSIEPPVYIGPHCTIEGPTRLGPNAVVSDGAFLNKKCEVRDALILPETLVGEGLCMNQCILDQHQLLNVPLGAVVSVEDDLLFGKTRAPGAGLLSNGRYVSTLLAGMMLAVLSPFLLALMAFQKVRRGAAWHFEPLVRLPARNGRLTTFRRIRFAPPSETTRTASAHFWLDVAPGLWNVVRGDLRLVGVAAPSERVIDQMPDEVRAKYLQCEAGLINEPSVMYGRCESLDERFAVELCYSMTLRSSVARVKRILGYLGGVIFGRATVRQRSA